jgi:transposase
MTTYVGLDVSQKATSVCVVNDGGAVVWEGTCSSTPEAISKSVMERAPDCIIIAFETGPLAVWHWHALKERGLPVVCIHARHAHAAIALQANKTDRNDACALAHVARSGWFRPVDMKSFDAHRIRQTLSALARVVSMRTTLYSQIRGMLKTFGTVLPPGKGLTFEKLVRDAIADDPYLNDTVGSLLSLWRVLTDQLRIYQREIERLAREHAVCRLLMTTPGVGAVTALAFVAAIDDPNRFRRSEDVGAYLGLTPRRYQSGEIDRSGRISKCGDRMARSLLFEAAHILLTRIKEPSTLRDWGRRLSLRIGPKKAKVAVARRLAVILHRMWVDGAEFNPTPMNVSAN